MVHQTTHLFVLTTMLALAASSDAARRTIPNWITVALAVLGLASQWMGGGVRAAAGGLLAGVAIGALLIPFWMKRGIGGGDLKLGVAAAVWLSIPRLPYYLLASTLVGAAVALICYAASSMEARGSIVANLYAFHAPAWPKAANTRGKPVLVPYGIGFAVGALYAVQF
jgi:prepilin peptidase CpaA